MVMNLRRRTVTVVVRGIELKWSYWCLRRPVWSRDSRRLYYVSQPSN
jgi:hypothetical protein